MNELLSLLKCFFYNKLSWLMLSSIFLLEMAVGTTIYWDFGPILVTGDPFGGLAIPTRGRNPE